MRETVASKRTHPDRPTLRPGKKTKNAPLSRFFSKLLMQVSAPGPAVLSGRLRRRALDPRQAGQLPLRTTSLLQLGMGFARCHWSATSLKGLAAIRVPARRIVFWPDRMVARA